MLAHTRRVPELLGLVLASEYTVEQSPASLLEKSRTRVATSQPNMPDVWGNTRR
jgi:hypothetical protein